MKSSSILLFVCCIYGCDALFGFGGSKTTTTTTTTTSKPSLGREIHIPLTDEDDGGLVDIPLNEPTTTRRTTVDIRDRTGRPTTVDIRDRTGRPTTVDIRDMTRPNLATTTINPRFTAAIKILPSSDRHPSSGCPNRIDAYSFGPTDDYAFYESNVYHIRNDKISHISPISEEFPNGPKSVNGALYDLEREIFWLIGEREVFGYKMEGGGGWKLQSVFPKELPSSVGFTPDAAMRWHNKHQVLLSNGGKFALYDEYWNKSLMTGRTDSYFENLPDRVKGISEWRDGKAHIYTQSLVFEYDADKKSVISDGKPLGDFWRC